MRRAAERLHSMGAAAVVITGGPARSRDDVVLDLLYDGMSFVEFTTARIATPRGTHGTGCTYASALAAGLALGDTLATSAARAQHYVARAIASGAAVGEGATVLDHFWWSVAEHRRG
jgi:hydroxymethylpyrimidine/phosphomethylpyrimidine kinase